MRSPALATVLLLCSALWAADAPTLRQIMALPSGVRVNFVALSPAGNLVAAICSDHQIRLWDGASGALKATLNLGGENPTVVQFSPGGELLGGGGWHGNLRVWNSSGALQHEYKFPVRRGRRSLQGIYLRVWNSSGALQHEYKFPARIDALAFAPKLDTIAVAPSELPLEVRTLAEGKLLASFPANFSGSIAIAFSPDGRWLASADSDTEVRVIDTAKLALHARSTDLLVEPLSVVFSSDSSRLNVGTADGVLNVINPDNGKVAKRFPRQAGVVYALCASPDGRSLTGAYYNPDQVSAPAKIMVWDTSSATLRASVPPPDSGFTGGAYLPDGTLVLTSGVSKELKLWSYR